MSPECKEHKPEKIIPYEKSNGNNGLYMHKCHHHETFNTLELLWYMMICNLQKILVEEKFMHHIGKLSTDMCPSSLGKVWALKYEDETDSTLELTVSKVA